MAIFDKKRIHADLAVLFKKIKQAATKAENQQIYNYAHTAEKLVEGLDDCQ
jgi:hypothetical protein